MLVTFVLHDCVARKGGNHAIDIMLVRSGEVAFQRRVQLGGHAAGT
jgi:hypothetical protein